MAYYHPCIGCAVNKATCSRRQALRGAIAGHSVTSIRFRCPERQPFFTPGERVIFSTWCDGQTGELYDEPEPFEFQATVLKESRNGVYVIKIDVGLSVCGEAEAPGCLHNKDGYAKAPASRLRQLPDDPRKTVCPVCLGIEGYAHLDKRCELDPGWHKPRGCLRLTETGDETGDR